MHKLLFTPQRSTHPPTPPTHFPRLLRWTHPLPPLFPRELSLFPLMMTHKIGVFPHFLFLPSFFFFFFRNVLPPTGEHTSIKPVSVAHEYVNVFVWGKRQLITADEETEIEGNICFQCPLVRSQSCRPIMYVGWTAIVSLSTTRLLRTLNAHISLRPCWWILDCSLRDEHLVSSKYTFTLCWLC